MENELSTNADPESAFGYPTQTRPFDTKTFSLEQSAHSLKENKVRFWLIGNGSVKISCTIF
jgi:hypothetical protein